jgi:hypothetical protein
MIALSICIYSACLPLQLTLPWCRFGSTTSIGGTLVDALLLSKHPDNKSSIGLITNDDLIHLSLFLYVLFCFVDSYLESTLLDHNDYNVTLKQTTSLKSSTIIFT